MKILYSLDKNLVKKIRFTVSFMNGMYLLSMKFIKYNIYYINIIKNKIQYIKPCMLYIKYNNLKFNIKN